MTPVHLERDGTARGELESPLLRSDARVAEGGALLRRYTGLNPYRGFESLSLRQFLLQRNKDEAANFLP